MTIETQPGADIATVTEEAPDGARRWPFSISVVMPAHNEAETIGRVIRAVREQCPDAEVIVVDDASSDATAEEARAAGARVIKRPYSNGGPGAPVKIGLRAATGDVVLILDADGQHNPADIPRLLRYIGPYDLVVAARADRASQQNVVRWLGNAALNAFGSYLMEMEMKDLTSGFRAMRRDALNEFAHLLPNQYGWPVACTLAFAKGGYHVRFEPVTMRKRQGGRSMQRLFRNGLRKGLIILRIVAFFAPLRVFTPVALAMFALGVLAFLAGFFFGPDPFRLKVPGSAVVLFVSSIIVFMFGLLAEQIAGLRFKGPVR